MRIREASVSLGRIFFLLFTIEINSAIANNRLPIGMMKMQRVTIYPNIYDYMKIHHVRFWTFTDTLRTKQDSLELIKQVPRNTQIFQNVIGWYRFFRQKRLSCWSVSDCSRLLNCLYRKQSQIYSGKWDRGSKQHMLNQIIIFNTEKRLSRIPFLIKNTSFVVLTEGNLYFTNC